MDSRDTESGSDDELLLSGIQHYLFCSRQWWLIHIEQEWSENYFTAAGSLVHKRAHDDTYSPPSDKTIVSRGLPLRSDKLGVYGVADIVEFHQVDGCGQGVSVQGHRGKFAVFPVEYKRGKTKSNDCDRGQLCLQAMCLEEMFGCSIPEGALWYNASRHREYVQLDKKLRSEVEDAVNEMRSLARTGRVPAVPLNAQKCKSCSLVGVCLPKCKSKMKNKYDALLMQGLESNLTDEP
jgi:CRISPR-associated exonuclease Cas4